MQESVQAETTEALVAAAGQAMDVYSYRRPEEPLSGRGRARQYQVALEIVGRVVGPADKAYERVAGLFQAMGHIALFRRRRGEDVLYAVPGALPSEGGRPWVALALFVATVLSVLWMGAEAQRGEGGELDWLSGVPFAGSLIGILLAHEMGHFLVSRRLGTPTSFPYFIPLPGLSLFGTMGAVMQLKAPPKNRRHLLAIGAAGPLAGLVVAIPVLYYGLQLSEVAVVPHNVPVLQEGNSILYASLKFIVFGRLLPSGGVDVFLHPVALAGWTGLLVTALNLIPAGQLDGGHIVYALFGERSRRVSWVVIGTLVALSVLWVGWALWAALVFFFGRVQAVPLDDITRLEPRHRALGFAVLVLAVLVFVPVPLT